MRLGLLILVWVGCLFGALGVSAHPADEFPQVMLQVGIDDEAAELLVRIPARDASLGVFAGMSPVAMDQMEPAALAEVIAPVFARRCEVLIDGVVVPPTILGPEVRMSNSRLPARSFPEPQVMRQGTLVFVARYETKGRPRSVSLNWTIYANEYDADGQPIHAEKDLQVVAMVSADDREQVVVLTPEEPAYTWHAADGIALPAHLLKSVPVRRNFLSVPALSFGLVLAACLGAFMLRGSSRRGMFALLFGGLAAGALALPVGHLRFEHTPTQARPADAEALAIFESLHRNIYRAFDFTNEGAVYDALAQSVDGPMLETIYNDVYQSLVMREQNGAVSKVVRVQVDEAALVPIDAAAREASLGPAAYRVHCEWTVDGLVTHFGHSHARTNAFEAVYTVAPRAEGWRIVDARIIQQQRIDDGEQAASDLLNQAYESADRARPAPDGQE